jgi:hypothetical protein
LKLLGEVVSMAKKWILLDILLFVAVIWLGRELYQQYEQFKTKNDSARIETVSVDNQAAAKAASGTAAENSIETPVRSDSDYSIISENTLFSDTRGVGDTTQAVPSQPVAPLNPRPVLVGTIMIDGQYTASVIDPQTAQAAQQRGGQTSPETRRVGDFYRGYQITSIEAEQMVLENGGRREVIPLNRTARRTQQPARAATAAARVIPIGPGGGASGGVTITMAGTTTVATPGRAVQNPAQNPAQSPAQNKPQPQQVQGAQAQPNQRVPVTITTPDGEVLTMPVNTAPPATSAKPGQNQRPAQQPQQGTGAQSGQRVIRSPFGDIVRPGQEQ